MRRLEDVLADFRGQAAVLRAAGHSHQARSMEQVCDGVRDAMTPYLDWLTEAEAMQRSGRGIRFLRGQFAEWCALGLAEQRGSKRYYRRLIVPRRANLEAARAEGARMGREAA
jgi:hypothetical protein